MCATQDENTVSLLGPSAETGTKGVGQGVQPIRSSKCRTGGPGGADTFVTIITFWLSVITTCYVKLFRDASVKRLTEARPLHISQTDLPY